MAQDFVLLFGLKAVVIIALDVKTLRHGILMAEEKFLLRWF